MRLGVAHFPFSLILGTLRAVRTLLGFNVHSRSDPTERQGNCILFGINCTRQKRENMY